MDHIPRLTRTGKGLALLLMGTLLFLYVTNILTVGLQTIFLLIAIFLIIYGFTEIDGYEKVRHFFKRR